MTPSPRAASAPRTTLASFAPRHVDLVFDAATTPRYWYDGDPFLTLLFDSLSLVFPEGERFFVKSVLHYRTHVTDLKLRDEVAAFAGQEGQHGKEHRAFNTLLIEQGFACATDLEREVHWILKAVHRGLPQKAQLAVTCALEHFTAMMAEQILEKDDHRERITDGPMRRLWTWHALEESEHKSVAFDVYEAVGGGYVLRVTIMLLATVVFLGEMIAIHARMLAADPSGLTVRSWLRGQWYLWGDPGLFRQLFPAYAAYFRPGFHPSDRDRTGLLAMWRERLFAT